MGLESAMPSASSSASASAQINLGCDVVGIETRSSGCKKRRRVSRFTDKRGLLLPYKLAKKFQDDGYFGYRGYRTRFAKRECNKILKHIDQVLDSKGFDVDYQAHPWVKGFLFPIDMKDMTCKINHHYICKGARFAIKEINHESGKKYELMEVEKCVMSRNFFLHLTLTAKEVGADATTDADAVVTILAKVYEKPACGGHRLEQWMIKPDKKNKPAVTVLRHSRRIQVRAMLH